tara:strand:- start:1083 stop:1631 length:549 start_codon:yes stop_codon:yes gene_type:complete
MLSSLLLLSMAAGSLPAKPTQGLLTIENFDCISSQISADQAQTYYAKAREGEETEAFESERDISKACQIRHGWSDIQTRNAFRVSIMDGWLLDEGLIEKIQDLGDFRSWLDRYYDDNVSIPGRSEVDSGLKASYLSGKLDEDLTGAGYPEDRNMREWVYGYFEWRDGLRGIEDDFRRGQLRQ